LRISLLLADTFQITGRHLIQQASDISIRIFEDLEQSRINLWISLILLLQVSHEHDNVKGLRPTAVPVTDIKKA